MLVAFLSIPLAFLHRQSYTYINTVVFLPNFIPVVFFPCLITLARIPVQWWIEVVRAGILCDLRRKAFYHLSFCMMLTRSVLYPIKKDPFRFYFAKIFYQEWMLGLSYLSLYVECNSYRLSSNLYLSLYVNV